MNYILVRKIPVPPELNRLLVEDMRAFEMENANDMWQLDTTYCSYITGENNRKLRTYLIMIVDDRSRMIVGYGFFLEDNAINVQTVLKRAIGKFGIPKRIRQSTKFNVLRIFIIFKCRQY